MSAIDESGHALAEQGVEGLTHEGLIQTLCEELVEISEGELSLGEIDPRAHLFDFGYVDSLRAVMLLGKIEEKFGIEIDDVEFVEELTTVEAIAARVLSGTPTT